MQSLHDNEKSSNNSPPSTYISIEYNRSIGYIISSDEAQTRSCLVTKRNMRTKAPVRSCTIFGVLWQTKFKYIVLNIFFSNFPSNSFEICSTVLKLRVDRTRFI